jgi:putative ABC transport system substrate-binding protein
MRRRTFFGAAAVWPSIARAQGSAAARPQVGFLHPGDTESAKPRLAAFNVGLRTRGFVDGQNVTVILRMAQFEPKRTAAFAADLVERKVSVILAVGPEAVRDVYALGSTIPIVALDLESDPVKSGLVASIARPGGNLTGLFFDFPDFTGKWLELLGEVVPGLGRIGVLWDSATGPVQLESVRAAATARGLELEVLNVNAPSQMEAAFQAATGAKVQAVLMLSSPVFGTIPRQVADLALRHLLPSITLFPEYAESGGLMAYGTNLLDLFSQAGGIVGKVLAGAKPGDLPVERPSHFVLKLNQRTAKVLGVTFPPLLLARADEVIE